MKKIFLTLIAIFAMGTVSAQEDNDIIRSNEATQDRMQQEPPRDTQTSVDRATRQAAINEQNSRNVRDAKEKQDAELERATGKEKTNPAETNSTTVKPPKIVDPVSAPPNSGNR